MIQPVTSQMIKHLLQTGYSYIYSAYIHQVGSDRKNHTNIDTSIYILPNDCFSINSTFYKDNDKEFPLVATLVPYFLPKLALYFLLLVFPVICFIAIWKKIPEKKNRTIYFEETGCENAL